MLPERLQHAVEEFLCEVPGVIRRARESIGLSQREVADALGWHRPTVSCLESGNARLTLKQFVMLCGAVQEDPSHVLRMAAQEWQRRAMAKLAADANQTGDGASDVASDDGICPDHCRSSKGGK